MTEPAHRECRHAGKFDCLFDEAMYELMLDLGDGEGDVQAPCAWFAGVDLTEDEQGLIEHYGARWIIARENDQGFFWVETFDTERFRDERLEQLRKAWAEWDEAVL